MGGRGQPGVALVVARGRFSPGGLSREEGVSTEVTQREVQGIYFSNPQPWTKSPFSLVKIKKARKL